MTAHRTYWLTVTGIVFIAALSRLLPHAPNATPLAAMALFAGAYVPNRRLAFFLPLAAMFASDLFLGFHEGMLAVYLAMMAVVCVGQGLRGRVKPMNVAAASVSGSVIFFLITNIPGLNGHLYPLSLAGWTEAYAMALPFFRNTLAGDLCYTALLFGGYALITAKAKIRILSSAKDSAR